MDYIRAGKGVIMTTSTFKKDELDFVDRIEGEKVVLIDCGGAAGWRTWEFAHPWTELLTQMVTVISDDAVI
jgi:hypothetical protein